MMIRAFLIATAASAALLCGCETVDTTKAGAVGIERHQQMLVSEQEVEASSQKSFAPVRSIARRPSSAAWCRKLQCSVPMRRNGPGKRTCCRRTR